MDEALKTLQNLMDYINKYSITEKANIKTLNTTILGSSGFNFKYESNKLSINIMFWDTGVVDISSIFVDKDELSNSEEIVFVIFNPSSWQNLTKKIPDESISVLNNSVEQIMVCLDQNLSRWC
ncbi:MULTISPECIES: hypothetical protein [Chryseobacterium]|uniref:hypothetical protein n=1 Tax=Chryseobacterium TaxID=59732 RepID=UPI00192D4BFB|nr:MULTISPECIES: hypothetical protein [Chryseobacterium]MCD9616066.1 hypothetical protein [Chryseobacterium gleum]QRA41365.1 hypothetical protein JNG87_12055 [Chryseobacterium cucumeris]